MVGLSERIAKPFGSGLAQRAVCIVLDKLLRKNKKLKCISDWSWSTFGLTRWCDRPKILAELFAEPDVYVKNKANAQSFNLILFTNPRRKFDLRKDSLFESLGNLRTFYNSSIYCSFAAMNLADHQQFQELLTPELRKLVKAFTENGHETRIVGGAVRDIILSRHLPKDIDLATTATPNEMMDIFKTNKIRYIETGLQHGTLTAHLNGHDFEITTLRIDTEHDGRRATVEFTNDWKLDAERRDLTFNAMSLDFDGNLYDYFGGCDDLKQKRVRFVGDPEKRIKEDFLRILRYFRFHGRISDDANDHDKTTLEVIGKCAYGLKNVAVERIWAEVSRILTANHAPSLLKHMYKLGVAGNIGFPPCTEKHLQEFESVWSQGQTHMLEPVTILMSLVDTVNEAEDLALMLKLSSAERNLGKFIVAHRNIEHHEDPKKPYQDILASCSNSKVIDKIYQHVDQLLRYRGFHQMATEIENWQVPLFPVNGNDLKKLGVKPGPMLGKILHELKELWMESYYTMNKDDLLERVNHIHANIHH